MELLHWSELAGLVVVAQVVFPRCSTAVLQVAQGSQFAVLVLRRTPGRCALGELAAGTLVERLLRALTDLLSPALLMLLKLRPESLLRPLGERSLCCAPPSP